MWRIKDIHTYIILWVNGTPIWVLYNKSLCEWHRYPPNSTNRARSRSRSPVANSKQVKWLHCYGMIAHSKYRSISSNSYDSSDDGSDEIHCQHLNIHCLMSVDKSKTIPINNYKIFLFEPIYFLHSSSFGMRFELFTDLLMYSPRMRNWISRGLLRSDGINLWPDSFSSIPHVICHQDRIPAL